MIFTDLVEIKKLLELDPDDTEDDVRLLYYAEMASAWIGEILNRPGFDLKSRTEYYNGTGTIKLPLKSRPVVLSPLPQVFVDGNGFYGASSGAFTAQGSQLTYGQDFCLQIDQDDGVSSRCGILIRIKNVWERRWSRSDGNITYLHPFITESFGNIKVVYSGGYTLDNLPAQIRLAANLLVSRIRYVLPLGMELGSENYEGRSIGIIAEKKDYLMGLVRPMIIGFRNHNWG